jgi:nitrite reductase/ring-hydroxylating ferredoxin subunit
VSEARFGEMAAARTSSVVEQRDELVAVGPYRRVIAASLERIWENVLDWEHLPYLHADSFSSIRLRAATGEGWRAVVATVPDLGGGESEIEVVLDRPRLRYTTRTLDGAGAGTEIITTLEPVATGTRIDVDFLVPSVSAEHAELVGVYYRRLYARLWDQDESMMVVRQRALDVSRAPAARVADAARAPVPLGPETQLRARLPLLIEIAERLYRIVDLGGDIVVHSATCPHMGGPLAEAPLGGDGCMRCPWHGYLFDARTGRSADERKLRLARSPRIVVDAGGEAWLRWK